MSGEKRPYSVELVAWDSPCRDDMVALRKLVFVEEQGVPLELELDDVDPTAVHAVARDHEGNLVGTGRLFPDSKDPSRARIGRMAVAVEHRGYGCGYVVLAALLDRARKDNYGQVVLSAQTHAAPFYARAGFEPLGETYLDCEIPHQDMVLSLPKA